MTEHLTDLDRAIIKEIEGNIPLSRDPYGRIASRVGCRREQVLERLESLKERGCLRRIGAVLHHRRSGYTANGMLVCRVTEDRIERNGEKLASLDEVSHCYQRRTCPGWPYNLYAMIHGKSREEVERLAGRFVDEAGIRDYRVLYSTEEIKKTSMSHSTFIS